jgi:hypothetical protein
MPLDDNTLALLATLSDLTGNVHGLSHIENVFNRSVEQVKEYRREKALGDEEYGPEDHGRRF